MHLVRSSPYFPMDCLSACWLIVCAATVLAFRDHCSHQDWKETNYDHISRWLFKARIELATAQEPWPLFVSMKIRWRWKIAFPPAHMPGSGGPLEKQQRGKSLSSPPLPCWQQRPVVLCRSCAPLQREVNGSTTVFCRRWISRQEDSVASTPIWSFLVKGLHSLCCVPRSWDDRGIDPRAGAASSAPSSSAADVMD